MKKIFIAICLFFMFLTTNVHAYNADLWENFIMPDYVNLAEYSSETAFSTSTMAFQSDSSHSNTPQQRAYFYDHMGGQSNDTYGTGISFPIVSNLTENYTYNASFILCSQNKMVVDFLNVGTANGSWQNSFKSPYVKVNDWTVLTTKSFESESTNFSVCRIVAVNFTANRGGNFLMLRFRSNTLSSFGNYFGFMGYQLDYEGQDYSTYLSNLENSINNLSSSINNQFNSLNSNINNQFNDLNDNITNEAPPTKLDNLNNSAGWLPAGPVDSILNLPLTMFQNLSDNIGASCTPLNIELPFVNQNINLPCLNSIYEQIDGLSVWVNSIGIIASAFILYSYLLKLYKWVDDTLTFRENNHIDNWGGI